MWLACLKLSVVCGLWARAGWRIVDGRLCGSVSVEVWFGEEEVSTCTGLLLAMERDEKAWGGWRVSFFLWCRHGREVDSKTRVQELESLRQCGALPKFYGERDTYVYIFLFAFKGRGVKIVWNDSLSSFLEDFFLLAAGRETCLIKMVFSSLCVVAGFERLCSYASSFTVEPISLAPVLLRMQSGFLGDCRNWCVSKRKAAIQNGNRQKSDTVRAFERKWAIGRAVSFLHQRLF